MQSILTEDFLHLLSCLTVKLGICVFHRIINKRQGDYVKSRIKCRINQVGMHGNLYRVSVHQCLDSLGLVSVCQLVCCIYVYFYFSSCGLFHQLAKLAAAISPGRSLSCGACKIPGSLLPAKVTVIANSGKCLYQLFCILVSLRFQFLNEPLIYTVNSFLKGLNVHILFCSEGNAVFVFPAVHDLFITGAVDVTFVLYGFLSCLVYNSLLFRCKTIINLLVDTEEQAVIDGIPHGAVWLNLLYTGCVDCRKRILLTLNCVLLKGCVSLRPVQVGCICAPSLIAFHKKVGTGNTDFQVFHIIHRFYFADTVGQFTETVLCNTHAMESVLTKNFF